MSTKKWMYFIGIVMLLTGCSSSTVSQAEDDSKIITLENVVTQDNRLLNERDQIEDAFETIKSLKKFSFITPDDYLEKASFIYFPEEKHMEYYESYNIKGIYNTIDLRTKVQYDTKKDYEFKRNSLNNIRTVAHPELTIEIGKFKEENFSMMLAKEKGNILYESTYFHKDFTNDLMDQVAHSLKNEHEGVYDLYFDRILIDYSKIKFPKLDPNQISVRSITNSFSEVNGYALELTYTTPDNVEFIYTIRDKEQLETQYEKIGTDQIGDVEVSQYFNEYNNGYHVYIWTDGIHFYELKNSLKTSPTEKEHIYKIIESSLTDTREFDDLSLFKQTNTKPTLTNEDHEIRDKIKMFSK